MNHVSLARLLALAAGLLDFGTGIGLVFLPAKILPLLRVPIPTNEALVYLRFVGAFVTAVGASYLLALVRGGVAWLRTLFEFTLPFRFATGIFSGIAVARGWLAIPWASVAATDFALIGIQLWLLPKLQIPDVTSSPSSSSSH
jgi:hypothetical protein